MSKFRAEKRTKIFSPHCVASRPYIIEDDLLFAKCRIFDYLAGYGSCFFK